MMFREIFSGWGFIVKRPEISRIVLAKGLWATGGGAQIFLLILIGRIQLGRNFYRRGWNRCSVYG